jgi:hypothetical protein
MYHDGVAVMQCLDQMGEGVAQLAAGLLGQPVAELDRVVSVCCSDQASGRSTELKWSR